MTRKRQIDPDDPGPARYAKGTRFEYKVRDDLIARGYVVVRSAGSKGKIDIVAFRLGMPMMLVQAKVGTAQISKVEWDWIFEIAGWYRGLTVAILAENGPKGHGVSYERITGKRIRYAREQPSVTYDPGPILPVSVDVDSKVTTTFRPYYPDPAGDVDLTPYVKDLLL